MYFSRDDGRGGLAAGRAGSGQKDGPCRPAGAGNSVYRLPGMEQQICLAGQMVQPMAPVPSTWRASKTSSLSNKPSFT